MNLKEIFDQKQYKRLSVYQKEIFVTNLFHSKWWDKIPKQDHILLLKELQNVLSNKYRNGQYQLIVLPSDYQLQECLFEMITNVYEKRILMRKSFIEDGIIQDGYDDIYVLDFLNVYLLDCIYHENYHIISRQQSILKSSTILEREFLEQLLWCLTLNRKENIPIMEQIGSLENDLLEKDVLGYYMIPDEYYAHRFAYEQVARIFDRTISLYGEDENFRKYIVDVKREQSVLAQKYNNEHGTQYTFDELYEQIYLTDIIRSSAKDEEEVKEVYQKLKERKHFIKR